jgi:hypothetical protein
MKRSITLSTAEIKAALEAISQMTDGNNRDYDEWRQQTHLSHAAWRALLRIETKLQEALQ